MDLTNVNTLYVALQAWLAFFWAFDATKMLVGAAMLYIVCQWLDNTWAGGKLFERKWAWITTTFAAIVVFFLFVIPNVTLNLLMGIVGVGLLIAFAFYQKTRWH